MALAHERGAHAWGLDHDPNGNRTVRGDLRQLPVADQSVDVVLAECSICLADDLKATLQEARRILDDGRLALSDVVVDGDPPELPAPVRDALCLDGTRDRDYLLSGVEQAGFSIQNTRDHREDLLAMRDELTERVDYEQLLTAVGRTELLGQVRDLEHAVEDGRISYISLVASTE